MSQTIELTSVIPEDMHGMRLDQALSELFSDYSRNRLKGWILEGLVTVNGRPVLVPREKINANDSVVINAVIDSEDHFIPEEIPLNIVYEDDNILVIDKPEGISLPDFQFIPVPVAEPEPFLTDCCTDIRRA